MGHTIRCGATAAESDACVTTEVFGLAARKTFVLGAVAFAGLAYGADWALAARSAQSVTVHRTYVVPLKNGRTEYPGDETVDVRCVRALLPHGDPPCWYLRRHTEQQVTIDSGSRVSNPH